MARLNNRLKMIKYGVRSVIIGILLTACAKTVPAAIPPVEIAPKISMDTVIKRLKQSKLSKIMQKFRIKSPELKAFNPEHPGLILKIILVTPASESIFGIDYGVTVSIKLDPKTGSPVDVKKRAQEITGIANELHGHIKDVESDKKVKKWIEKHKKDHVHGTFNRYCPDNVRKCKDWRFFFYCDKTGDVLQWK